MTTNATATQLNTLLHRAEQAGLYAETFEIIKSYLRPGCEDMIWTVQNVSMPLYTYNDVMKGIDNH